MFWKKGTIHMSFHTIIIVGNMGRDPEMRYMPNGDPVTNLSVASSRSYTNNQGQKVDETVWFRVSVFGKMAESCSKVLVEGRLNADKNGGPRVWTRQDGTPGASFEVTAQTVRFLSSRSEGGASGEYGESAPADSGDGGDIPF